MKESRQRIVQFINGCYEIADEQMTEETKATFLFSNRATYPFITLSGLLHTYLFNCGKINSSSTIKERVKIITPYIETLCDGLNHIPEEEASYLKGVQGQGAEKKWLLSYQNIINKAYPDYFPEELKEWREMRDQDIQSEGNGLKDDIRKVTTDLMFIKLREVYGKDFEKSIQKIKNQCEGKIIATFGDNVDFDLEDYDWKEWIEISDIKSIIESNYSYDEFSRTFGISLTDKATSKKEKLSWLSLIEPAKAKKNNAMTKSDVNRLWNIIDHLKQYLPIEE